ncbi:hypothetical protein LDENG_00241510 [Lucifuga dentata]|nr:hypothetical protein LDENG_00241510 [Lucifuga dentata]
MAHNSIKMLLAETLEDLGKENFEKFCHLLKDRKEEPRVRRNRVDGKSFLEVSDVMVSTFTKVQAVQVTLTILRQIGCNQEADGLDEEIRRGSYFP